MRLLLLPIVRRPSAIAPDRTARKARKALTPPSAIAVVNSFSPWVSLRPTDRPTVVIVSDVWVSASMKPRPKASHPTTPATKTRTTPARGAASRLSSRSVGGVTAGQSYRYHPPHMDERLG